MRPEILHFDHASPSEKTRCPSAHHGNLDGGAAINELLRAEVFRTHALSDEQAVENGSKSRTVMSTARGTTPGIAHLTLAASDSQ